MSTRKKEVADKVERTDELYSVHILQQQPNSHKLVFQSGPTFGFALREHFLLHLFEGHVYAHQTAKHYTCEHL